MKLLKWLQETEAGWGISFLRIALGVIFFREGAGKLFGWFGGGGFAGTCAYFVQLGIPFPEMNALLVGWTEFLGGIAFATGLLTRLAAIPIALTMVVAILTAHRGGGWSYPLLIIAAAGAFLEMGSGFLSLDRLFSRRGCRCA